MQVNGTRDGLMVDDWNTLTLTEQMAAKKAASEDGVQIARELYGETGSRQSDDRTIGYRDYYLAYLKHADPATQDRWHKRTVREVCGDARVYSFVSGLERERRRLLAEPAVPVELEVLAKSHEITLHLAEQICADVNAEAQLSEMMLAAARDRAAEEALTAPA